MRSPRRSCSTKNCFTDLLQQASPADYERLMARFVEEFARCVGDEGLQRLGARAGATRGANGGARASTTGRPGYQS